MAELTQSRLRELLHYEPDTGTFVWLVGRGGVAAGTRAGCVMTEDGKSRLAIRIDGVLHYAHRLAWLYMTGEWPHGEVDHKDMDGLNNRWRNLRSASHAQNQHNRTRYKNNSSGFKGVTRNGRGWGAEIWFNSEKVWLGTYSTAEQAHNAYAQAASRLHGEFARVV